MFKRGVNKNKNKRIFRDFVKGSCELILMIINMIITTFRKLFLPIRLWYD